MLRGKVKVTSTSNFASDIVKLKKRHEGLGKVRVWIGIPEGEPRADANITQAQLLYILSHGVRRKSMRDEMQPQLDSGIPYSKAYQLWLHEHGSPLWKIPPRPVLEPAIENAKAAIAKHLKLASQLHMAGKDPTPELHKAGQVGADAAKAWFVDPRNNWPPNAPETIKQKIKEHSIGTDTHPMIDTGSMRNAITYVVTTHD